MAQEMSEHIFFVQPKVHQFKFADLNKMVPTDLLKPITFFEQCQTRRLAFSRKSPRTISSQKRRKWLNFLLRVAMNQATSSIVVTNIMTTIKATNAIATITNPTIVIETIDATIVLDMTTQTGRAPKSPRTRRKIASAINPTKRATRPCIMTSPLCQAPAIHPEEEVILVQDLFHALVLSLTLAQAAGAMTTTMWLKMTVGQVHSPSVGTRTPPRVTTADVSIALTRVIPFLPAFWHKSQRNVSAPRNRDLRQLRTYVSHWISLFQMGNQTF